MSSTRTEISCGTKGTNTNPTRAPPPDCRPSEGASAPKGTCRWLSLFGGSAVRTALNYNYHRAAGRILCRRLKYATGYCKWQSGLAATIH
ncbi:unnamed protein product [Brassica napus]|nr:unnamed protein product [Brassica napus]